MIKNLLSLVERRLERLVREKSVLHRTMNELQQQQLDVQARIQVMKTQSGLYEQPAEFTRTSFFERQRHKAGVLAEIARLYFQLENLQVELQLLVCKQNQLQRRLRETNNRCEKFRIYLKQLRIKQCLKSEIQQQNDFEELSIYAGNKPDTQ
ncbi:hypothetical protein [Serratia symbiotica]|uniref:Uncharacterized protein n=1 Tax=Serratia symbiotica TaxID=138074 RepID=A0A068Z6G6_9GAMM|nr:hypothetical protein [Serratia symbiotica]MBF1996209.1 hypothetical protein [Serratia symbiotica]MBQ0954632.1 hypothetical protein [Serratia symbiotica]QLH63685.1 hypothetical protein SYMBAF_13105 [Serratia symbiotica]QTP14074.1 hypothetical protein GPZ83_0011920 [Serratia symbiotica]CDS59054.1 conserved hypothetical protein [Serratia symbiotica]